MGNAGDVPSRVVFEETGSSRFVVTGLTSHAGVTRRRPPLPGTPQRTRFMEGIIVSDVS